MTVFRALNHRNFRFLWTGQTISRVGDFAYEIALAWWVLEKTGSAETMSAVLIFALTPSVLFSVLGGVAGDRWPRAGVMFISDLLRSFSALMVATLALAGRLEVWEVFGASLLFGFVDAFFQPAYAALVPQLVPEAHLASANALTSISLNLGRVLGPAAGAAIVTLIGTGWAFALNGVSFLVAAAFLGPLLRAPGARCAEATASAAALPAPAHPWQAFREGVAAVVSRPWLWIGTLVFSLSNITLVAPYSVAMPFLVKQFRQSGVDVLGLIYACFPLGYVVGGLWFGRYARLPRRGLLLYLSLALAAVLLGLFGLGLPLWVLLAAGLVNGMALELNQLAWLGLLQEKIPNEQLGRVFSIDAMGSLALLPIGYALVGWGTQTWGAQTMFLLGGGFTALVALGVVAFIPAMRQID